MRGDRIRVWGLDDRVKELLGEGLSPREVAKRVNLDPAWWRVLGEAKVYARDVEEYMTSEEQWTTEQEAKMLAHTTQGRQAIVEVHESVQWLTTFVNDQLMPFAHATMMDVRDVRDRWRREFDSETKKPNKDPPGYPLREIKGMESVVRLVKDLVDSVRNDPKIQSIVKAGNLNVQHGITEEGMWERLNGVASHLECPNCGHEGFTRSDVGSAYARWRSASRVVDAET